MKPRNSRRIASARTGGYVSRCEIPADFLNEGRYVLGVNASSYRVRRYFQEEQAMSFSVDATGAPGCTLARAAPGTGTTTTGLENQPGAIALRSQQR